jgi:hypothetical protein
VAASIKLSPIVLVVLLFRRGLWQASTLCLAIFVATLAAGAVLVTPTALHEWVSVVLPSFSRATGWMPVQSWNSVITRLAGQSPFGSISSRPLQLLAVVFSAAGVLAVGWLARPGTATREVRAAEFAIMLVAMLLATSLAWDAQYVFAIPLLAVAATRVRAGRHADRLVAGAFAVALIGTELVVAMVDSMSLDTLVGFSGQWWWWLFLQVVSLPALGAAALAAAIGLRLLQSRGASREPSGARAIRAS